MHYLLRYHGYFTLNNNVITRSETTW